MWESLFILHISRIFHFSFFERVGRNDQKICVENHGKQRIFFWKNFENKILFILVFFIFHTLLVENKISKKLMEKFRFVAVIFLFFPYGRKNKSTAQMLGILAIKAIFKIHLMEKSNSLLSMEKVSKCRRGVLFFWRKTYTPVISFIRSSTSILNIESEVYLRSICSNEAWIVA